MKIKFSLLLLLVTSFSAQAQWTGTSATSATDNATRLGNVGIGISSTPAGELHLKAIGSGNTWADMIFESPAGKQWSLSGRDNKFVLINRIDANTTSDFFTVLDGTGFVGIGPGLTAPLKLLHVGGDIQIDGRVWSSGADFRLGSGFNRAMANTNTTELTINYANDFTGGVIVNGDKMRIDGMLGIGTSNPQAKLHVKDANNVLMKLQSTLSAAGNWAAIDFTTFDNNVYSNARIAAVDVGSNNNAALAFYTDGDGVQGTGLTEQMRVAQNGNIGIGTINPFTKLEVSGGALRTYFNAGQVTPGQLDDMAGPLGTRGIVENNAGDAHIRGFWGVVIDKNGGNLGESNSYNNGVNPAGGSFAVRTRTSTTAFRTDFIIRNNGNVGIGTTAPSALLHVAGGDLRVDGRIAIGGNMNTLAGVALSVNGSIYSKATYVTVNGWSDNIFDSEYQLKGLDEVEEYIKKHKHLPSIPSEKEIMEKGLDTGEMLKLQMAKIEELTLYVIELKKEVATLKKQK